MDNLDKQLQEFWESRTSPEQRREILRQLEESGMEWREFMLQHYNQVLAGQENSGFSSEQKSRGWQRLQERHFGEDVKVVELRRPRVWIPWAAAACVIVFAGFWMYRGEKKTAGTLPMAEQPVAAAGMIVKENTGVKDENFLLPDHSLVQLAPGSSIRYPASFEARARNIQLEGRALFDVARDSVRPFTVIAQGFATTALGTRFIVDATRPLIYIRLLKGKIVVNATADASMALQRVYLVPGQELKINITTKRFDRVAFGSRPSIGTKAATNDNVAALSFERTSLAAVFQRLSEHYKTPIQFDKADVQDLSFTGDFKLSDELELALKVICNMNQLSFTKENDRIRISKKQ
ncbi:MAG TPA: FecR domain-containing protein [Puia sp.]